MNIYIISGTDSPIKYLEYPIEKISFEFKQISSLDEGTQNMMRCPSFRDFYKNTFVYKSPIDFNIFQKNGDTILDFPNQQEEPIDPLFVSLGGILEIFPFHGFFVLSDKDVVMDILPPALSSSIPQVCASLNVGKWTRSIHPVIIPNKQNITVKRGDPLLYLRFRTDEKVKLKFRDDKNITEIIKTIKDIRKYVKGKPLQFFYDIFEKNKIRNKIIKILEKEG